MPLAHTAIQMASEDSPADLLSTTEVPSVRVLTIEPGPAFSVADVHRGWVQGLKANGCEVATVNLSDRLDFYSKAHFWRDETDTYEPAVKYDEAILMAAQGIKAACYDWWPDLVLIVSAFFIPRPVFEVMRDRRHTIVLLHTESPYEDDRQIQRAPYADLNVLNDPTNLERFQAFVPTVYIPHGYDPEVHRPRRPTKRYASDFAFVGTGFPSRIEFFEKVDWTGVDATFAGNWRLDDTSPLRPFLAHDLDECCPNDETVRLYTSTKVAANLYRKEASDRADGWACGPREVELAATSTFFLREPRGEGDELFPMLPTFKEPAEFGDLVRWWMAHPAKRKAAAAAAFAAVSDRTFDNHAADLLRLVDKIPARRAG